MIKLLKIHGSENTFFILDVTQFSKKPTLNEISALTVALKQSDYKNLNNIDGILVVDKSDHADCLGKMTVVNADGSIASMCGNGLRTVSRYLANKYGQTKFKVETRDADLAVEKYPDLADQVPSFGVTISPIRFNQQDFPFSNLKTDQIRDQKVPELDPDLKFTAIAVPNPHLISFVSKAVLKSDKLKDLGTYLNGENPYFTDGVNVNFAQIIGPDTLFVRTFERGVGFTNACGTGMSSTSLAYALNHYQGDFAKTITVYNPGGMVKVKVTSENGEYHLQLIANATNLGHLNINESDLLNHDFAKADYQPTDEESAYQKWVTKLQTQA
ncbi:diaminopimelate epimerase [Fructilactobacillus lindneri]|uniref:Diaminopimelate epimerase n=2 Tax=Fructilactobacillus lindneri TaxID=53444 RepID=A0A0R2JMH1_9LACO|nr:diaminopimelate epimerase [Fructilactobacillus lindneri]ANZ57663.1 diaminopimelate epimerase [Fructilactobacillus lindneri]ANZ58933.1 diaminopimelate epimerase [Fructilactobacillus lindneri]KRN78399.1 Diaminopimelate epimerase [Fructilactobacillus lindneri DSM 20690 = JCM 11027]POG97960.1 diaminopimelate epimerase [Fructilactobacillus lindneri]POG99012.1 diaminopimelate epimerase [Fructilactobacillus lindneri]